MRLSVWRDRKLIDVNLPVRDHKDYVMPPLLDKYPRYSIYGPMVFTQVTQDLATPIAAYSGGYTSHYRSPLAPRLLQPPAFPGEEIVALTVLLKHRTSKGYSPPAVSVVAKVEARKSATWRTWSSCCVMPRASLSRSSVSAQLSRWSSAARKSRWPPRKSSPTRESASNTPTTWRLCGTSTSKAKRRAMRLQWLSNPKR